MISVAEFYTKDPAPLFFRTLTEAMSDQVCPICHEDFEDKVYLPDCPHNFCFVCIHRWSKVTNTCPLCKVEFSRLSFVDGSRRPVAVPASKQICLYTPEELEQFAFARVQAQEEAEETDSSYEEDDESFSGTEAVLALAHAGYKRSNFVASDNESVSYSSDAWQDASSGEEHTEEDDEDTTE